MNSDDSEFTLFTSFSYYDETTEQYICTGTTADYCEKVTIDGVEIDLSLYDCQTTNYFMSSGEHIIKYTLKDEYNKVVPDEFLAGIGTWLAQEIHVTIPYGFTSLGTNSLHVISKKRTFSIPSTVVSIGDDCFACTAIYKNQPNLYERVMEINPNAGGGPNDVCK